MKKVGVVEQTCSIVVIDDDPQFYELTAVTLSGTRIEMARAAQPAVTLLDMMMPWIDGITTCKELMRDRIVGNIPLVGRRSLETSSTPHGPSTPEPSSSLRSPLGRGASSTLWTWPWNRLVVREALAPFPGSRRPCWSGTSVPGDAETTRSGRPSEQREPRGPARLFAGKAFVSNRLRSAACRA